MALMIARFLDALWRDESGQDLLEYTLLMAFLALAAVAALTGVQSNVSTLWHSISNALSDALSVA
jgi:Flp pilus assembly pilin Flp